MKKEEAINILNGYKERLEASCSNQLDKDIEAFGYALSILKKLECASDMRLIDANMLIEAIENRKDYIPANDFDIGWNNAIEAVLDDIYNAPTIEYTFEKAFQKTVCEKGLYCPKRPKGKWIDSMAFNRKVYRCSNCNEVSLMPFYNFCPSCGADMQVKNELKTN